MSFCTILAYFVYLGI